LKDYGEENKLMAVNKELNRKVQELFNILLVEGKVKSQKDFCHKIDYLEPSYCQVISGKRSFPKNKIPVLVTIFELDQDYFDITTYSGKQDICDKITYIRKLKELTQRDFAKELNVTQSAISAIENKTNKQPSYDIIWGLINKLKVNPYFLFSDDQVVFDSGNKLNNKSKLDQAIKDVKHAVESLNKISL
jgi:transcriptional regulator with XRE-family HTH domain